VRISCWCYDWLNCYLRVGMSLCRTCEKNCLKLFRWGYHAGVMSGWIVTWGWHVIMQDLWKKLCKIVQVRISFWCYEWMNCYFRAGMCMTCEKIVSNCSGEDIMLVLWVAILLLEGRHVHDLWKNCLKLFRWGYHAGVMSGWIVTWGQTCTGPVRKTV
jgi:hypothetical protein